MVPGRSALFHRPVTRPAASPAILPNSGILRREEMPVNTFRLASMYSGRAEPSEDVIPLGYRLKVEGSNTSWYPAQVIRLKALGDGAMLPFIGHAVGELCIPSQPPISELGLASCPQPTMPKVWCKLWYGSILIDSRPEPLLNSQWRRAGAHAGTKTTFVDTVDIGRKKRRPAALTKALIQASSVLEDGRLRLHRVTSGVVPLGATTSQGPSLFYHGGPD